jgi:hypothetical protein
MSSSKFYDEVTIRVRPIDGLIRVEERTGNVVAVKNISPNDLIACLEKGVKESKTINSGFLPENCISYDVNNKYKTVALWIPPGYVDFTYHNTVYEHFPLPAMALSFTINAHGRTYNHRMAIIADEMPAPKTQLYVYPFSNVYANSGICVGTANSLPVYKNIRTLGTLPYLILSLPNNDHNFSRTDNAPKLLYRDLLELLKNKEPSYYYEHILIPRNATLQDFIENKLGGMRHAA